jgi:hypothetical protein
MEPQRKKMETLVSMKMEISMALLLFMAKKLKVAAE